MSKFKQLPWVPKDPKKLEPGGLYVLAIDNRYWVVKMNVSRTGLMSMNQVQGTTMFFNAEIPGNLYGPMALMATEEVSNDSY